MRVSRQELAEVRAEVPADRQVDLAVFYLHLRRARDRALSADARRIALRSIVPDVFGAMGTSRDAEGGVSASPKLDPALVTDPVNLQGGFGSLPWVLRYELLQLAAGLGEVEILREVSQRREWMPEADLRRRARLATYRALGLEPPATDLVGVPLPGDVSLAP